MKQRSAKHAIEGLTKSMAIELGSHGTPVNSIGRIRLPATINAALVTDVKKVRILPWL